MSDRSNTHDAPRAADGGDAAARPAPGRGSTNSGPGMPESGPGHPAHGAGFDVVLRLLSNPIYLSGARDLVTNIAGRVGFDELGCGKLALAIDEALCNIIRHGYDDRTDRPITVSIGFETGADGSRSLLVIIEDEGRQVDPATIVGRPIEEVRPGGLGVHIIREVMDEVHYEKRDIIGMRVRMRKALPEPEGDSPHVAVRYGGHRSSR